MYSVSALLISNLVFATLLAVLAATLTRLWRNPQFAHALWLLVLVKLVTPPLILLPLPEHALVLSRTKVTDKGIVHLIKLKQLQHVSLQSTKVTDSGVKRLRAALPACKVGR